MKSNEWLRYLSAFLFDLFDRQWYSWTDYDCYVNKSHLKKRWHDGMLPTQMTITCDQKQKKFSFTTNYLMLSLCLFYVLTFISLRLRHSSFCKWPGAFIGIFTAGVFLFYAFSRSLSNMPMDVLILSLFTSPLCQWRQFFFSSRAFFPLFQISIYKESNNERGMSKK